MVTKPTLAKVSRSFARPFFACLCALLIAESGSGAFALLAQDAPPPQEEAAAPIPPEQLDALVAPIALYPDSLLAQTLAAATYPLEVIQLKQWLDKNKGLKDQALVDEVAKQPWDASVQALAAFPEVVNRLADDVQWATDLGNAFLDQQGEVMDAVQRMRAKAKETGALKTTDQQKVETKVVEEKTVVVVEPADPQIVYVPQYNPVVVYGPPIYPYPPIYYPPPPRPGAVLIAFGIGVAWGSLWGRGGWGWGCGWGRHHHVSININNTFVRRTNININNRPGGGNEWRHNPTHRGGAPYANRATANKFGGTARGDSLAGRRPAPKQGSGGPTSGRPADRGLGGSGSGTARPATGGPSGKVGDRGLGGSGSGAARPATGGPSGKAGNRGVTSPDKIGSRDIPRNSPATRAGGAFGSASRGTSGARAGAARARGSQSAGRSAPSRGARRR